MNKDVFVIGIAILLPALAFGVCALAVGNGYLRGRRWRPIVLGLGYVTFGFGVQVYLGWRYFRNEFAGLVFLLLVLHAVFWIVALRSRYRSSRGSH